MDYQCRSDGIGSHARLKIVCGSPACGFDSHLRHHLLAGVMSSPKSGKTNRQKQTAAKSSLTRKLPLEKGSPLHVMIQSFQPGTTRSVNVRETEHSARSTVAWQYSITSCPVLRPRTAVITPRSICRDSPRRMGASPMAKSKSLTSMAQRAHREAQPELLPLRQSSFCKGTWISLEKRNGHGCPRHLGKLPLHPRQQAIDTRHPTVFWFTGKFLFDQSLQL